MKLTKLLALALFTMVFVAAPWQQATAVEKKRDKFAEARKKAAVPESRKKADKLYRDAIFLMQDGWEEGAINYPEVERKLAASISTDPTYTTSYLLLGEVYEQQANWKKAIDTYRSASRKSIDKESGFVQLGRVYARIGKIAEAKKILSSTVKRSPFNAEAKAVLASVLRKEGDFNGAKKLLRAALKHSPKSLRSYKELALVSYQTKDYNATRLALLKSMKLKSDDPEVYNLFGLLHLKEGDKQKAVDSFKRAVEIDDRFLPAHMNLSSLYLQNGYFKQALQELKMAERLQPNNPEVLTSIGVAHRGLGDYQQAEASLQKALSIDPNHQPATYNLGLLYYRFIGDSVKAASYFKDLKTDGSGGDVSAVAQSQQFAERIALTAERQKSLQSLEDGSLSALQRLQKAGVERLKVEERVREVVGSIQQLTPERRKVENEIGQIDKKLNKAREERGAAEKELAAVVASMSEAYEKLSAGDEQLLSKQTPVQELAGQRLESAKLLRTSFSSQRNLAREANRLYDRMKKIEKPSGISHSTLVSSIEQLNKERKSLESAYAKRAAKLTKLYANWRKANADLSKLREQSKRDQDKQREMDTEFQTAASELFKLEERIDKLYAEIRTNEDKRQKSEGRVEDTLKELKAAETRRSKEEASYWSLAKDRKLEEELAALDRKRNARGVKVQALEKRRRKLLTALKDQSVEIEDLWQDVQFAANTWKKQADGLQKASSEIASLESRRKEVEVEIGDLLSQRQAARGKVANALKQRNKLDKVMDRIQMRHLELQKKLVEVGSGWQQGVVERNEALDSLMKLEARRGKVEEELATAKLAAADKIKDAAKRSSYDGLREELKQLAAKQQAAREQLQSHIKEIKETDAKLAAVSKNSASMEQSRKQLVAKLEKLKTKRLAIEARRLEKDSSAVNLRKKRRGLEKRRRNLEKQRLVLDKKANQLLQSRLTLAAKENELQVAVKDQAAKRRELAIRDLLSNTTVEKK